jgi:c-di-GMP-binding flagellar brake protein YcgR
MGETEEKRRFRRHAHAGEVLVGLPDGGLPGIGSLINLSLGGCKIRLLRKQQFDKGTRIELWLKSSDLTFRSLGIVRRRIQLDGKPWVLGVEFVDLAGRGHAHLTELIAELEMVAVRRS